MENILTDGHCLSPYTCKRYTVFKQFDGLNFDCLAGKHQKHQNFALYSIHILTEQQHGFRHGLYIMLDSADYIGRFAIQHGLPLSS